MCNRNVLIVAYKWNSQHIRHALSAKIYQTIGKDVAKTNDGLIEM